MSLKQPQLLFKERKQTHSAKGLYKKDSDVPSLLTVDNATLRSEPHVSGTPSTPKRKSNSTEDLPSPPKSNCTAGSLTPSSHLNLLTLTSPSLGKKGSCHAEKLPPKELFPESVNGFSKARIALHTHATASLPGRETELAKLSEFIKGHLKNGSSGSLYVSGPPGTGKTACLTYVMEQPDVKGYYRVVSINCTSMKSAGAIYSCIATQLGLKVSRRSEKAYLQAIEKHLQSDHNMILLVLDEMDQLDSRGQSVLYTVFEWPATHHNGLVLVGIANALDLTDRTLPRLKARTGLAPELLHFAPYTKQQLVSIFSYRLNEAGVSDMFSEKALQLLATKVATVSGDVRKALDIGRRAVERTDQKHRQNEKQLHSKQSFNDQHALCKPPHKPVSVNRSPLKGLNSPKKSEFCKVHLTSPRDCKEISLHDSCHILKQKSPRKELFSAKKENFAVSTLPFSSSKPDPPKLTFVDVKEVMSVVNEVYGTSHALGRSGDGSGEELPLQQKLAVCSLLLMLRKGKNKDVTVGKLHEVYKRVCTKRHIDSLDQAAFLSMLGLVETRGLLHLQGKGKPGRLSKVCLQWVEDEVVAALQDKELLASIMSDVACLA